MGRIFKTPKDDSVEETLRAMHLANTFDNHYEWGLGWIRTLVVGTLMAFIVSAIEANSALSLWELTVEWFYDEVSNFGQWLVNLAN
tara:strand:+ start:617 stop:874 length:258 start_codon:yes stop_codon:yes gene_type:complete